MSDTTEPRNPFTTRGFLFGAILVGVLALAAVLIGVSSLWGGDGGSAAPAVSATPSPSVSTSDEAAGGDSVCGLTSFEATNSLTSPPIAEWTIAGTVAVPGSATAGPGVVDEGFRSCFSHTAEGALFSAISFVAMSSDARTASRVSEMVAPGVGRDTGIANRDPNAPVSPYRLQLAGYNLTSYTADEAVVDLAWTVTSSGGALVSQPLALSWSEGDWKVDVADNGQPRFSASPLTSLGGYTPWSGT